MGVSDIKILIAILMQYHQMLLTLCLRSNSEVYGLGDLNFPWASRVTWSILRETELRVMKLAIPHFISKSNRAK